MSIIIETHLICDGCGKTFGVDMRHRNGTEHRRLSWEDGWAYSNNKDWCPDCRPVKKNGELRNRKTDKPQTLNNTK